MKKKEILKNQKNYFIWGNSGHAGVIYDLLENNKYSVKAILDDDINSKKKFKNLPLIKGRKNIEIWIKKNNKKFFGVVAIGNNLSRVKIINFLKKKGVKLPTIIHPKSIVSKKIKILDGNQILAGAVISSNVKIGYGCIFNHNCVVDHDTVVENGVHIAPSATVCGNVFIDREVLIGANSTILPGSKIKKKTVVKAGTIKYSKR